MRRRSLPLTFMFASVALAGGSIVVMPKIAEKTFPVEKGENHLKKKGYTDIRGGQDLYVFSPKLCGNKAFQRNYTARKHGSTQTVRVCYDLLIGPYRAPIQ